MSELHDSSADSLAAVRHILLEEERQRLHTLEARLQALHADTQVAQQQIITLEAGTRPQALSESLAPVMSTMVRRTIHNSKDEMAEALGPVMGEAIRVQIRDARNDMVNALYPIIGEMVQRAIAEFAREFQRNIDARLQSFRSRNVLRLLWARLRGVSSAELAMRDVLPFRIKEIFIIQHGSGLLLAHTHPGSSDVADSDLVSAMLTAIRDFVQDAFGDGGEEAELDEVQYGDEGIIVQSGQYAYVAVVIEGVEPEGFRAGLRQFVSELHIRHGNALRDYDGDPATLPNLQPSLAQLVIDLSGEQEGPQPMTPAQRWMLGGSVVGILLFLALACFYLRFTLALLPVAFPADTPTPTFTATATPLPTFTATPTPTFTATPTPTFPATPSPTASPSPTVTPSPTATSTPSLPPTPMPMSRMSGNVWTRHSPDATQERIEIVLQGTTVEILARYGDWVWIRWQDTDGTAHDGWVPIRWVELPSQIPAAITTPTVSPGLFNKKLSNIFRSIVLPLFLPHLP